ncbi:MAG: hypothetical protein ABJ059_01195, partial [Hyphomicrobiales bacterium]
MSSARHGTRFFSGRPCPGFSPPAIVSKHFPADPPLIGRPLNGPRKKASFEDGRLEAPVLCLVEDHGVRHEVVNALSALEV